MAVARAIRQIPPDRWEGFFQNLSWLLPRRLAHPQFGYKLHKLAGILPARDPQSMYFALVSHWLEPESVVLGAKEPETLLTRSDAWPRLPEFAQQMMFLDAVTYLPNDILTKVDRATMAVSLEARIPMLDHRVAEFAWRLPTSLKIRNGRGKWILRRLLRRFVPAPWIDRSKSGFGVPLDRWLRGPLRDWAESLLDMSRLRSEGFLNPQPIHKMWNDFLAGNHAWQYHLWDVLMFQAWLSAQQQPKLESEHVAALAS
jgi:asparagine synthase (glutamine-hydrolysing)